MLVGIFENQYENKEPLTITGDGFQRRDFIHIDDIVDGLILTSENETCWDEIELGRGEITQSMSWQICLTQKQIY